MFMLNEQNNNPSETVTSEQGVSPEEGQENVEKQASSESSEDVLKRFSESAGRDFNSLEDAFKWADNTKRMVGDQTISEAKKKAEAFDSYLEKIKPLAEAEGVSPESYLDYSLKVNSDELPDDVSTPKEYETKKIENEEMQTMRQKLEELQAKQAKADLLKEIPSSEKLYDDFAKWAKGAGVEANAENFKSSPFNSLTEAMQSKQNSSVIESSAQVGETTTEYEKAVKAYNKSPNDANAEKMIALKMKQMEG